MNSKIIQLVPYRAGLVALHEDGSFSEVEIWMGTVTIHPIRQLAKAVSDGR